MHRIQALFAAVAALGLLGAGCSRDDGLKPEERKMASRLDEITKRSGGDWNKLSAEDRRYLIQDISRGSEQSARMLLMARGGRLRGTPGSAPGARPAP